MSYKFDITVLSGISLGDVFHFEVDETSDISIGRSPENDLVLQDPTASRQHASILFRNHRFVLADSGSSHGTIHMGFRLQPGEENARALSDGDEFKIGDAIFRIEYDEDILVKESTSGGDKAPAVESDASGTGFSAVKPQGFVKRIISNKLYLLGIGAIVILGLFALTSQESRPSLPRQKSKAVMNLPKYRVIGFYGRGRKLSKHKKDLSHLDKAQFVLPASDLLLEFEFRSEAPVDILFDEALVYQLKANPEFWQKWQVVVRDPAIGKERRLVFDNLDYPRKKGKKGKIKQWGIRNLRATPVERSVEKDVNAELRAALGLTERLDKTPDALFSVLVAVKRVVLQTLVELNLDAIAMSSASDEIFPDAIQIKSILEGVITERRNVDFEKSTQSLNRHLDALTKLTSQLDSELWRRANSRFTAARVASEAKNYIDAHDHLLAAKEMIPDETDLRWRIADEMFHDKAIVPKKVRDKPYKYRKQRMNKLNRAGR